MSWGASVPTELRAALAPAIAAVESATRDAGSVGIVVGAPSAASWGRVVTLDRLIVMPVDDPIDEPFLAAALERAAVRIHLRGASAPSRDLGSRRWTVVDVPAPLGSAAQQRGVAASDPDDALSAWTLDTWASLHPGGPPEARVAVRVVRSGRAESVARILAAWAAGAAVVAVCDRGEPSPTPVSAELVAHGSLEAAEAVELLVRAPRLARAFVRRGRLHLERRVDSVHLSRTIIDALEAAEPGREALAP